MGNNSCIRQQADIEQININSKFSQIIEQIEKGKMPLSSYTWMHGGARLSMEDKKLLVEYFNSLMDNE